MLQDVASTHFPALIPYGVCGGPLHHQAGFSLRNCAGGRLAPDAGATERPPAWSMAPQVTSLGPKLQAFCSSGNYSQEALALCLFLEAGALQGTNKPSVVVPGFPHSLAFFLPCPQPRHGASLWTEYAVITTRQDVSRKLSGQSSHRSSK